MNNKAVAIFTFFAGIFCFAFAVATAHGWNPLPTAQAAMAEQPNVIPQDAPTNIEVDGQLAVATPTVTRINQVREFTKGKPSELPVPEMKIAASKPAVNPGAARRRQVQQPQQAQQAQEESRPLESPTELASEAALNYRPLNVASPEYVGHAVRGPGARAADRAYSNPIRSLQRPERETWEFEAK